MSKRRKNHDLYKRRVNFVRGLLRSHNVAIVRVGDEQLVMSWKNMRPVRVSPKLANDINYLRHNWVISIAMVCRDQFGKRYFRLEEVAPPYACQVEQMMDSFREQLEEMRKRCPPAHYIRTAWIALPYDYSLTEQEVDRVLEKLDAWEERTLLQQTA